MPFTKHIIEPINIAQCPLPAGEPNELECLSNLTLANIIRQLSSLGQHAGRIFDELSSDAVKLNSRAQLLHQRLENLKLKCNQLDIQSEEVSLADFQTKKQFKSAVKIDQQVVSRKSMPDAMRIMYNNADPPPSLEKLNPYRSDGKDCLKFYTDPDFFFNIWCNELIKDNETRKKEKKNRRSKSDKQPVINQQTLKSPLLKNGNNLDLTNGISLPMMQQLQQSGLKKPFNQYDDTTYYQQQILLLNQAKQQQIYFANNNANSANLIPDSLKSHYAHPPHIQHNQMKNFDDHLIIPMQHMQSNHPNIAHYDIYSDSNKLNLNGNSTSINNRPKMHTPNHKNTPNGSSTERPMLPPPPIPNNQLSDLQQIQQQMIKKKLTDISIGSNNGTTNNGTRLNGNEFEYNSNISQQPGLEPSNSYELPPPPSPPSMFGNLNSTNNSTSNNTNNGSSHTNGNSYQRHHQSLLPKLDNDFDMPLPPPPLDLPDHDSHLNHPPISPPLPPPLMHTSANSNNNNNTNNSLPPPPPLPPLVESDTTSSSSSLSINNNNTTTNTTTTNNNSNQTKFNSSMNEEIKSARNNYLDDISQRRFQLRSTAAVASKADTSSLADESRTKETSNTSNNNDNKQPWTKSADVAAIIDFVRNYRPYVRDSSDDDDEDSEWDS